MTQLAVSLALVSGCCQARRRDGLSHAAGGGGLGVGEQPAAVAALQPPGGAAAGARLLQGTQVGLPGRRRAAALQLQRQHHHTATALRLVRWD